MGKQLYTHSLLWWKESVKHLSELETVNHLPITLKNFDFLVNVLKYMHILGGVAVDNNLNAKFHHPLLTVDDNHNFTDHSHRN